MAGEEAVKGTVNLFGSKVKKGYVIAGGLVVGAAVLYGFYKNKKAAASGTGTAANTSAPSASSYGTGLSGGGSDPYPPDGTTGNPSDPNSTDPASGLTYGDEGAFGAGYAGYGWGGGYGGGYSGYGTTSSGSYVTNGEWAQGAEQYLVNTVGADATTVAAALGKYITGQPLTQAQVSVVQQAIAFTGNPPTAGAGGDPPGYQLQHEPPPAPKPKPKPKPARVTVPNVLHQPQEAAYAILHAAGLKASGSKTVHGRILHVVSQSPKAGTHVAHGSVVHLVSK